ncbi:MAG: hypothetical protein RIT26_1752 [Pseudomonadota bacterium]
MDSSLLIQLAWTGLATSSFYCLSAIAFSLMLRVNQVWNFGQAGLMAIAFYTMFVCVRWLEAPMLVGIAVGLVATVAAALSLEHWGFGVLRQRKSNTLTYFIFTITFSNFLIYLAELIFGTEPKSLVEQIISPVIMIEFVAVSHWDLMAVGLTAALVLALYLFLTFTATGHGLLAVADNPDLAEAYGINSRKIYLVSMALAAVLLVACMFLFGTKAALFPSTPLTQLLIYSVIATLLAGMGNIFSAGLMAVLLSLIQAFSILVIESRWQAMVAYVLIFVVILIFPQGVMLHLGSVRKWFRRPQPAAR